MIHFRPIRLARWFPPDDPVAAAVARLCILREDFLLELYGIIEDSIPRLDDNEAGCRRVYFWRNSLRTLEEIRATLNRLSKQPDFTRALNLAPPSVQSAFQSLRRELNKTSHELLRQLRNTIAAHLDGQAIQDALNELDPSQESFVQIGDILGKTHYKFAADLLMAILLQGVAATKQQQVLEDKLSRTSKLIPVVGLIDAVVEFYLRDRRLP
jgi:hypothetical protein